MPYDTHTITHQSVTGYVNHEGTMFSIKGMWEKIPVTVQPDPIYVQMSVTDAVTNEAISNVALSIKNSADVVVDTVTTDTNGEAEAYSLPVGSYMVDQQPVSGYFDSDDVSFSSILSVISYVHHSF